MSGMVGRVYRWRGREWRVLARWRDGGWPPDQRAFGCDGCGAILKPGHTVVGGCDCGMGWACYVGELAPYRDHVAAGGDERSSWHVPAGQLQWWRERTRAPRNVLIEDVDTGERVVRPFRGLRRAEVSL